MINPEQKAREIIGALKEHFIDDRGLLIAGGHDERRSTSHIIDDFGDFAPFLSFFGQEEICKTHLDYLERHRNDLDFREAFRYTDLLLGLVWYSRIGRYKDQAILLAWELARDVEQKFGGYYPRSYIKYRRALPFLYIFNTGDATFIEVFVELHKVDKGRGFLEKAERMFAHNVSNRFFKKWHVLPEVFSPVCPSFLLRPIYHQANVIRLMKNNTNFGFGLLELWRVEGSDAVKQSFEQLYTGLRSLVAKDGGMRNLNTQDFSVSDLLSSFAVIDLMCDAHVFFRGAQYLSFAKELADFWLTQQSSITGLMPRFTSASCSYLDNETDMVIALFKLHEISGEEKYKNAAMRLLKGIFDFHFTSKGPVLEVDIYTGKKRREEYKTKYTALFLKPLIRLAMENEQIYENEKLFMLLKDR